ncbi:MAG TPA: hypothetical protein VK306_00155 [Acidimicrobiales bacterium]|nr:hypothetical protein [Acidimicrobiales bacterium]
MRSTRPPTTSAPPSPGHQRSVTTLIYAQVGQLAAVTALVLALAAVGRGWV